MARKTNNTIEIFRTELDWEGNLSSSSLGTFDVYLEETATKEVLFVTGDEGNHSDAMQYSSRGFFILWDDVDLDKASITYDGEEYTITAWDRFTDMKRRFHHIEATYK